MTSYQTKPPVSQPTRDLLRLQRTSRLLAFACWGLIIALPPLFVWFWVVASPAELAARVNLPADALQGPFRLWQRVLGACISAVSLGLLLQGLWQLKKCLALFATGQVFTLHAVSALQRFAGLATAALASSVLAVTALTVLLTLGNPPGTRQLAIVLSTDQLFALFYAGMVWLMAKVIAQGLHLAEENANFV